MGLFQDLSVPLNSESPLTEAKSHEALLKAVEKRMSSLSSEIEQIEYELPTLKETLANFQEVKPKIIARIQYLKDNAEILAKTWNWEDGD